MKDLEKIDGKYIDRLIDRQTDTLIVRKSTRWIDYRDRWVDR